MDRLVKLCELRENLDRGQNKITTYAKIYMQIWCCTLRHYLFALFIRKWDGEEFIEPGRRVNTLEKLILHTG